MAVLINPLVSAILMPIYVVFPLALLLAVAASEDNGR